MWEYQGRKTRPDPVLLVGMPSLSLQHLRTILIQTSAPQMHPTASRPPLRTTPVDYLLEAAILREKAQESQHRYPTHPAATCNASFTSDSPEAVKTTSGNPVSGNVTESCILTRLRNLRNVMMNGLEYDEINKRMCKTYFFKQTSIFCCCTI